MVYFRPPERATAAWKAFENLRGRSRIAVRVFLCFILAISVTPASANPNQPGSLSNLILELTKSIGNDGFLNVELFDCYEAVPGDVSAISCLSSSRSIRFLYLRDKSEDSVLISLIGRTGPEEENGEMSTVSEYSIFSPDDLADLTLEFEKLRAADNVRVLKKCVPSGIQVEAGQRESDAFFLKNPETDSAILLLLRHSDLSGLSLGDGEIVGQVILLNILNEPCA